MTTTSKQDANTAAEAHRLGLHALAGSFKVSLSFFRTALKVNPKIIEYWASYIEALNQFCLNHNCTYEVLAASFFTKQVAVRLLFSNYSV